MNLFLDTLILSKYLQVASVRVQLNQLREDLDGAVKSQDFARANEIKMQIAELDAEKVRLLESTEVVTEEVRTERVSYLVLLCIRPVKQKFSA